MIFRFHVLTQKAINRGTLLRLKQNWRGCMTKRSLEFSSVVSKEGKSYVARCPELEVASQGKNVESALENLKEAIELYLEDEDAKVPEVNYRPMVSARVSSNS